VGPRDSLDDVEKRKFLTLPGLELQPLGHPSRSQSLYRLRYPGYYALNIKNKKAFEIELSSIKIILGRSAKIALDSLNVNV
jgi:hypothetical protein